MAYQHTAIQGHEKAGW